MRFLAAALCAVLAGCGNSRQVDEPAVLDPALSSANETLAQCRYAYPDEITQAVARAACVTKATELLRPMLPFPDLLDQENALRSHLQNRYKPGSYPCSNEISKSPNFIRKCWRKNRAGCWQTPHRIQASRPPLRSGGCQIPMAAPRWAGTGRTVTDSNRKVLRRSGSPRLIAAVDRAIISFEFPRSEHKVSRTSGRALSRSTEPRRTRFRARSRIERSSRS